MTSFGEQDHYEALEVGRGASAEEIERAYKIACSTYAPDSLAGYSVFQEGDSELLRERVEAAYRVLGDPRARERYDADLAERAAAELPMAPAYVEAPRTPEAAVSEPPPNEPALDRSVDLSEFDEDEGWDGARLRRARLQQGIELEQIAKVTKVNPTYLQFIEEEQFESLPAAVYVRGFVIGYAEVLGFDAPSVAKSYMQRYDPPDESAKRRLFSRR